MKKLLLSLLLLVAPLAAFAQQSPILCSGSTACNTSTGPSNTGTGDALWKAYGKVNANDTQLYGMFGVSGLLKGNGAVPNALTQATSSDVWSVLAGSSGSIATLTLSSLTGSTQCLHVNSAGLISGTGVDCGSGGGGSAWSGITSGTNTTAALLVGSGASLGPTGTGTIAATTVNGVSVTSGKTLTASNSLTLTGTDATSFAYPGASGTVDTLNSVQTFTATKTFSSPTTLAGVTLSGITGSTQCLHVNTSGVLSGTGSDCGSGGSLPSVANQTVLGNGSGATATAVALALGGNLVATTGGLATSQAINTQTGTSYTVCAVAPCSSGSYTGGGATPTDAGSLLTFNNAGAVAVTLPAATTTGFTAGFSFDTTNYGAGTVTFTPTTSTIGGTSTLTVAQNTGCTVSSDGSNYQLSACTAKFTGGGGSGTITSSTAGQIPVYTGATTVAGGANATLTAGALTLGLSGTAGSVKMGNATSGTVQVQPVTGALGTVTASLPANTGTVAELNLAQTWSALQTFGTNISIGGVTATGATGTGLNVFGTSPTLITPALGTPSSAVLTNATGLPVGGLAAIAAGTFIGNATGSSAVPTAVTSVSYLIDAGATQYTLTGTGACATTTKQGTTGTSAGQFTCTGTTGASTVTITLPTTTNGWRCSADDQTTAITWRQTANTTTSVTLTSSGSIVANDVIAFGPCAGH